MNQEEINKRDGDNDIACQKKDVSQIHKHGQKQQPSQQPQPIHKLDSNYPHYYVLIKNFYNTRSLFKILFLQWKVCLKCIFKIYAIEIPKLYSDYQFFPILIEKIIGTQEQAEVIKKYNNSQCTFDCKQCWLCEEVLQQSYIKPLVDEIIKLIHQKKFQHYEKFKLNIKIPLSFILKYYFFCRYLNFLFQTASSKDLQFKQNSEIKACYKVNSDQLNMIQKILKSPYDALSQRNCNSQVLQIKVVLKWLIAHQINSLTPMQSTIQDSIQMLTVNIEQVYHNSQLQSRIMKLFHNLLGLEKKRNQTKNYKNFYSKPHKKVKIDLGQQEPLNCNPIQEQSMRPIEQFKCITANVNKIIWLNYAEIYHILKELTLKQFTSIIKTSSKDSLINEAENNRYSKAILQNESLSISHEVTLLTQNIYLCGRYTKHSRYLSQTPWMVNGQKLTEGSLQQQIQDQIYHFFYPQIKKEKIEIKFHAGGRQDIDVRMLKGGRPFVLQFVNPILRIRHLDVQHIIKNSNLTQQTQVDILKKLKSYEQKINIKQKNELEAHSMRITFLFQQIINRSTQLVQVCQFLQTDEYFISIQLKKAEIEKIKHYLCYIISQEPLSQQDVEITQKIHNLEIQQNTPLRVLHRRTLMIRKKMIHKAFLHLVTKHSAVLQLWASAGTYIKQFVHGDLCRTLPNFGTIINKKVDILQLDVGSLKEGQWQQGAQQSMKIQKFQWMN